MSQVASTAPPEQTLAAQEEDPAGLVTGIPHDVESIRVAHSTYSQDGEAPHNRFLLTDEYLPLTRRRMKQSWRYLRRPTREGSPTELDIKATIDEIGHKGMLFEPILIPPRVNRTELLLLVDQGGSMVPFHILSSRLVETAQRGGRLGSVSTYYFHNCPVEDFYRDHHLVEAESIDAVLRRFDNERTRLLIISDAGAARGTYNVDRIVLTEELLDRLKQQFRYIVWLNPMPRSRWRDTTAEEIMHAVPMLEVSRRGFDDAIRVLRGQHTPVGMGTA